jgi:hypothetical protein
LKQAAFLVALSLRVTFCVPFDAGNDGETGQQLMQRLRPDLTVMLMFVAFFYVYQWRSAQLSWGPGIAAWMAWLTATLAFYVLWMPVMLPLCALWIKLASPSHEAAVKRLAAIIMARPLHPGSVGSSGLCGRLCVGARMRCCWRVLTFSLRLAALPGGCMAWSS